MAFLQFLAVGEKSWLGTGFTEQLARLIVEMRRIGMNDFGGRVNCTICVDVCPPWPTITFARFWNEIARGTAIPASRSDPPPTG